MTTTNTTPVLPRRLVLTMALLASFGIVGKARANAELVDLTVVDRETGETAQVWRHRDRFYVAGQPGARYAVRIANNTGARVLVVMSVDGVNVMTGETAGYAQRGYVLRPFQTYDVNGWRKSDTEVAAFAFAPSRRSYAAQTGRPADTGVIGIAVFKERLVAHAPPSVAVEARRAPAPAADSALEEIVVSGSRVAESPAIPASPRREERLGTAHGAREWSHVTSVRFNRASASPDQVYRLEYDTHRNLVAAGVIRPRPVPPVRRPNAFPGNGYVPDPPGGF